MSKSVLKLSCYTTIFLLLTALASGAVLRFWKIDNESLWWDEYATHLYLSESDFQSAFEQIRTLDPLILPAYPWLEYYWAKWVSPSVISLRTLSVLIGLLTLLCLYFFGKKLFDSHTSLFAVFLLAWSPVHIHHSQGIRMYGLFILIALLSLWSFVSLYEQRTKAYWLLHALAVCALIWTHPFAILVVAAPALYLLLRVRKTPRFTLGWAFLQVSLFLPQATYLSRIRFWPEDSTGKWIAAPSPITFLADLFFDDITSFHWQLKAADWTEQIKAFRSATDFLFALLIVLVLILCLRKWWRSRQDKTGVEGQLLIFLWILLPPLALFIASWIFRPCMFPRYTAHCVIPTMLALSCGAMSLKEPYLRRSAAGLLMLGLIMQWVWLQPGPQRTDWLGASRLIAEEIEDSHCILVEEFLWRDIFKYNAEKVAGLNLTQPQAAADNDALLAAQAFLSLSMPEAGIETAWAVIARDYFDTQSPEAFESFVTKAELTFEHWRLPAIRDIYVYKLKGEDQEELSSLETFQKAYHAFMEKESQDRSGLSHGEVAALGDLAQVFARHDKKTAARIILEDLTEVNSFAREFYVNLIESLQSDQDPNPFIDALEWLWKGYGARDNGQVDYAITCFNRATEKDPRLAIAYLELVIESLAKEKNAEALAALRQARHYNPDYKTMTDSLLRSLERGETSQRQVEALVCYRKAALSLEGDSTGEAKSFLEKAVALDEKLGAAFLLLAYIHSVSHEEETTEHYLHLYSEFSGTSEEEALAHIALMQGEHREGALCAATLESLFARAADYRKVYGSLREACSDEEQLVRATASIKQMWRAYDYLKEGEKEKARGAFQKALERNPGNVLATLEGGLLQAEAGDYEEAYASLLIASKGDPDYQRLLAELLVALEKGDVSSEKIVAISALREGLRFQSLGDFTAAREALEQAVLHDPELTEAHTSLAFLLVSQKQYDAAEKVLDRYLAHERPGVAGAYGLLAVIYIARGDEMAAKDSVVKAKSIDAAYDAQFGPFFDALLARSSFDAVQTELARLKAEGTDLQWLMGDLIENFFFQNE